MKLNTPTTMWNNCTHYLHQISQPLTPRSSPSSPSYEQKTLSPRVRFPHLYRGHNFDPSIQLPQPASPRRTFYANQASVSPVYAYPYRPTGNTSWPSNSSPRIQPSPRGVYPRHLNIGTRFGLVPATPRTRAAEEEEVAQRWWPSTVELVESLSVGCGEASKTRGIGPGPADEEAPVRVDRFKIRTVDIDEMIVQEEANKK